MMITKTFMAKSTEGFKQDIIVRLELTSYS